MASYEDRPRRRSRGCRLVRRSAGRALRYAESGPLACIGARWLSFLASYAQEEMGWVDCMPQRPRIMVCLSNEAICTTHERAIVVERMYGVLKQRIILIADSCG